MSGETEKFFWLIITKMAAIKTTIRLTKINPHKESSTEK